MKQLGRALAIQLHHDPRRVQLSIRQRVLETPLEQLFTVVDPATGVQLGFISRTGHRVPISGHNVRALFSALGKI